MNINELDSYNLQDAINFHTELNPQLFVGDEMRPPVRNKLMEIAQDFVQFIGISDIALVDITLSGSNAAYSYTPHSDIDLHLIVDFNRLNRDEVFRELFDAKKYQYNDQHDIKIKGYDVEVYVQDASQPHSSLGEYSVNRNDWNKIPTKHRANLDDTATRLKYEKLRQLALQALAADDPTYLNNVLNIIKRYRRAGLADGGEFGPENLAFKMIRQQGLFKKLWDKKHDHEDKALSLEHDDDKQEFNYLDNSQQISEAIKQMYKQKPDLFETFTFDAVYETANLLTQEASYEGNVGAMEVMQFYSIASDKERDIVDQLIARKNFKKAWQIIQKVVGVKLKGKQFEPITMAEDGRIVKGVNTTVDVGVNQIKIEAGKMGFNVTKDGRPPLLRESYELLEDEDLLELKMSPGRLRGEIGKILQKYTPVVGLELEVCWPRGESDFESDGGAEITNYTTWDDIEGFFEHNSERDFYSLKQDWDEWVMDQSNEWARDRAQELVSAPTTDSNIVIDAMVNNYVPNQVATAWIEEQGEDELVTELAEKVVKKAAETIEKFGSPFDWDMVDDLSPEAQIYYDAFVNDDDSIDTLYDHFNQEFFETELAWDDQNYTIGAYLTGQRGYDNMRDLFYDFSDELYWPGGSLSDEIYDDDIAAQIESDFEEMGITAAATGEYHSGQMHDAGGRSEWNIEEDTTIAPNDGDAGFEIISPPLDYVQGQSEIGAVFNYLNDHDAYTNDSTGLHINVSVKGINHSDVDYPKLVLMLGDKYVLKQFGREVNQYALAAVDKLSNVLADVGQSKYTAKEYAAFVDKLRNKADKALASSFANELRFDKYTSVHFREEHVEFRAGGGAGYLDNFEHIWNIVNRCVFAYVIAADPEAYKEEYAKKLYKLMHTNTKTQSALTTEAMKLFALFRSGAIDKAGLMQRMKVLKAKRAESPKQDEVELDDPQYQAQIQTVAYDVVRTSRRRDISPQQAFDMLIQEIQKLRMEGDADPRELGKARGIVLKKLEQAA